MIYLNHGATFIEDDLVLKMMTPPLKFIRFPDWKSLNACLLLLMCVAKKQDSSRMLGYATGIAERGSPYGNAEQGEEFWRLLSQIILGKFFFGDHTFSNLSFLCI